MQKNIIKQDEEVYLIPPPINGKNDFLGLYVEEWIPFIIGVLGVLFFISRLQLEIATLMLILIIVYFIFICRLFGKRNIYYILKCRMNYWIFSQQVFKFVMEGVIKIYVEETTEK
jgi:hypothetical protein